LQNQAFFWKKKAKSLQKKGVSHPLFASSGLSPGDWHMMEMATEWVWCVCGPNQELGAKRYGKFLEEKLPFAREISRESGHYMASWKNKIGFLKSSNFWRHSRIALISKLI
jgi:hypothetical protein